MASKFSSSKQIWNRYRYSIMWFSNMKSKVYLHDNCLSKNYILNNVNISNVKIKNRCVFTNRSRAIFNQLKLTRMAFKNLAVNGLLTGIKLHSW